MTFWYTHKFDRRRMRRELRELSRDVPLVMGMWHEVCGKGDAKDLELTRLQMADLAEENGRQVLAKMIREWMSCVRPRPKRRRAGG